MLFGATLSPLSLIGMMERKRKMSAPGVRSTVDASVNVKAPPYSARGDGVTNDTTAIQQAVRAVAAAGGGVLEFPTGDYLVEGIAIPRIRGGTLRLVGHGWNYETSGANTRLISAAARPMFTVEAGADGLELSLMHLDGNGIGTHGWYGEFGNKARLLNVLVDRFTRYGIYFNQGLCELRHSYVRNNLGVGVRTSSDGWFDGNEIGSNGGTGLIVSAGGNRITDNLINSNDGHGIHITGDVPSNLINSVIGGYLGENKGHNILIEGVAAANRNVAYTTIMGCFIQQVGPKRAGGIAVRNARQIQILGLNFLGGENDAGCISMESCDSSQILGVAASYTSGNVVRLENCDDISVSGVTSRDNGTQRSGVDASYAIHIGRGCHRCSINDVRVTDTRSEQRSRGIRNFGQGTVVLGAYSFTGASDADVFGSAAVMTYDVQQQRWRTAPAR